MALKTLNDDNFETEVLESELPVLVDFYATWCGPCKVLAPIVEKIAGEYDGRFVVGKLNIDEAQKPASDFRVLAVPTLIFFHGGKEVDRAVGALREAELRERMEKVLQQAGSTG